MKAIYEIEIKRTRILCEGDQGKKVNNSRDALDAVLPFFADEDSWREQCHVVFVDRSRNVVGHFLAGIGGENSVTVPIKPICRAAVGVLAMGVVLAHNHPSGNPKPGDNDIKITKGLKKALDTLDIVLLDHIIIGDSKFYSFFDEFIHDIN